MDYVLVEHHHVEEDEAHLVYSELDDKRQETRRVEFFHSGICFSYGEERGCEEALAQVPFPQDLRTLNRPGETEAHPISRSLFQEVWNQAQERPDGFMGMMI